MTKKEKNIITVDEREYNVDDLSDAAKAAFDQIKDLDRKLDTLRFNADQIMGGRIYWGKLLKDLVENPEQVEAAE